MPPNLGGIFNVFIILHPTGRISPPVTVLNCKSLRRLMSLLTMFNIILIDTYYVLINTGYASE